jgi:hypothetical protein
MPVSARLAPAGQQPPVGVAVTVMVLMVVPSVTVTVAVPG